jgi:hypothetical protein
MHKASGVSLPVPVPPELITQNHLNVAASRSERQKGLELVLQKKAAKGEGAQCVLVRVQGS